MSRPPRPALARAPLELTARLCASSVVDGFSLASFNAPPSFADLANGTSAHTGGEGGAHEGPHTESAGGAGAPSTPSSAASASSASAGSSSTSGGAPSFRSPLSRARRGHSSDPGALLLADSLDLDHGRPRAHAGPCVGPAPRSPVAVTPLPLSPASWPPSLKPPSPPTVARLTPTCSSRASRSPSTPSTAPTLHGPRLARVPPLSLPTRGPALLPPFPSPRYAPWLRPSSVPVRPCDAQEPIIQPNAAQLCQIKAAWTSRSPATSTIQAGRVTGQTVGDERRGVQGERRATTSRGTRAGGRRLLEQPGRRPARLRRAPDDALLLHRRADVVEVEAVLVAHAGDRPDRRWR